MVNVDRILIENLDGNNLLLDDIALSNASSIPHDVPEPASAYLLGAGLLSALFARIGRRARRRA